MFGGKFFLNEIMVLILVQPKSPLNARGYVVGGN